MGAKPPRKLNTSAPKGQKKQQELTQEMDENLKDWDSNNSENNIEEKRVTLKGKVYQTASDVLGHPERKHQDWFNEHDEHLRKLLEARNTARQENLQCGTRLKKKKYSKAQSELQTYTREMKAKWWDEKAEELQTAADRRDMKTVFTGLREIYGPKPRGLIQLKAMDGETVCRRKQRSWTDLQITLTNY